MILTSDIHLTDRQEDEYRWGLFEFLARLKTRSKRVFILGDLTVFKDNHSAALVNRMVEGILSLVDVGLEVHCLKGNHDYVEASKPFFKFLGDLKGVYFYTDVGTCVGDSNILMLPHTYDPMKEWGGEKGIKKMLSGYRYVMMHQTIDQSIASNGQKMEGMSRHLFKGAHARVFSGDIHVPQDIAGVTYVGAPYHITYGDSYDSRIIIARGGYETSVRFDTVNKHTLNVSIGTEVTESSIKEGDQVKLKIEVVPGEDWESKKRDAIEDAIALGASKVVTELVLAKPKPKRVRVRSNLKAVKTARGIFKKFVGENSIAEDLVVSGNRLLDEVLDGS